MKESMGSLLLGIPSSHLPLLGLALLPVFLTDWSRRKENRLLMAISGLALLPLFFIAIDWGRWIYIYVFMLFTFILAESTWQKMASSSIPKIPAILYLTLWHISHCCSDRIGFGFAEQSFKTLRKVFTALY